MDNKINHNRVNNINFNGIKPKANEVKNMDELIKKMVADLLARAEREVPEYGEFRVVWEEFKNPDKSLEATDFLLKITKPPKTLEGSEKERYLEAAALKRGTAYGAESVMGFGSKQDILNKLKEPDLCEKLKEKFIELSKGLEDV